MARIRRNRGASNPIDENTLNLRELAVFVGESPGFRLGLATYDVPETRDAQIRKLAEAVADQPVFLTTLDLTRASKQESLLKRFREHLLAYDIPDGKHPAVMVIDLEAAIDFRHASDSQRVRGGPLLRDANFERDAFPRLCPAPVVLWLSPTATTVFAQAAPDLWHWRSGSFVFKGSSNARRTVEKQLIEAPLIETDRLTPERRRERLGLLHDLLAEIEVAEDRGTQGNLARRAAILLEIGLMRHRLSEVTMAKGNFEKSLQLYSSAGDRRGAEVALNNLGLVYSDLGQLERAIEHYEQALTIAREIGDRRGEGNALGNLGTAASDLGQVAQGVEFHGQALIISREIGDRVAEAADLAGLGLDYSNLGQVERAIEFYEQALTISHETGDRVGEAADLAGLGLAYFNLGQVERAIESHEQALTISHEIGDRRGEGYALGYLGLAYSELGQREKAIGLLREALASGRAIENPPLVEFAASRLDRLLEEASKSTAITAPRGPGPRPRNPAR